MEFNVYEDVNKFWKDNKELILEREWFNCLMVGNCKHGIENGTEGWFMGTVTTNERTELILLYRKPWKLLWYSPTNNMSNELFEFAANEIYKRDSELLGVNTDKESANKFAEYYCKLANMKHKVHTPLRILLLEEIETGNLKEDLIFRKAKPEEKNQLIDFIIEFNKEALGEVLLYKAAEEKYLNYASKGYYVLEKDGRIVSQATLTRDLENGKCVSGVFTPKEERGKGYAYNIVYRLSKKMLDEGAKYCVLYTDDENPISNHVYEKIGYKRMVDCEDIEFYK